ncbi:hypothetical protein DPMN_133564 [Dreissena polymorpha]|uniref:Uncharacterized protein n=1 Tax=Dreissena polymorpha TaxID=45954 RepID=A0A9D4JEX9_DREPO|nr:hypothetical protein DPMN_133564 [Dreissena polymorpha]
MARKRPAQNIIGTNLLTKFHEDWKINVASRPPGSHVFQPTNIIFQLFQDIIGMNLLTKFHEDWTTNVATRVLTRFYYSHITKNAPCLWWPAIIGANLLTKFHDDGKLNVTSRVHIMKNAPPLGSHIFQANIIIFKHIQDMIETNLLTKYIRNVLLASSRGYCSSTCPCDLSGEKD